jgi:hypothetical protein
VLHATLASDPVGGGRGPAGGGGITDEDTIEVRRRGWLRTGTTALTNRRQQEFEFEFLSIESIPTNLLLRVHLKLF